jgi:hypothetical protein
MRPDSDIPCMCINEFSNCSSLNCRNKEKIKKFTGDFRDYFKLHEETDRE